MEKENLLFFSIPYDRGFSARLTENPGKWERVDFGLTAIPVPAGTHEIVVTYMPRGFVPAAVLGADCRMASGFCTLTDHTEALQCAGIVKEKGEDDFSLTIRGCF